MKPCGFVGTPNLSIVPEGTVMEIWTAHNVTSQGGILVFGSQNATQRVLCGQHSVSCARFYL